MRDKKISIAYFGGYDPSYTRVRTVLKGLRNNFEVYECHSQNKWRLFRLFSLAVSYLKVAGRVRLLMVSEGGQSYVPLAKILAAITAKPLLFDAFISYYHVKVIDTGEIKKNSLKGRYYYYLDKFSCELADLVLLDTEEHVEYFCKTFHLPEKKFSVVPAGSDDEIFYPRGGGQRNKKLDFLIFLVASFYPIHGVEHVVQAAKILEKYSDIKFLIVGDGITKPKAENLARELGLKNVAFRGSVTPYALADLMVGADVCLGQFGKTEHAEMVVPAKVFDAAAMEKPIITGAGRAVKSVFTDGENAFFVEFGDPNDLANKILLLKQDSGLRQKISKNAYRLFKENFSLAETGRALNKEISKLIDEKLKPNFFQKIQLLLVCKSLVFQNFLLQAVQRILFKSNSLNPQKILIYKVGNIGDIVCAIPSFIAIRKFYPAAKITLLSSPGNFGTVGAQEFFEHAWYFDNLHIYYSENTVSFSGKKRLINELKKEKYDLFVQLPDDLAGLKTLFRNMIFAKLIGVRRAFGFKIRTVQLFKKTQVDYGTQKYEAESLLDLLRENEIKAEKAEYDFNISETRKERVDRILKNKWPDLSKKDLIVVLNPGGKREANRWPAERFGEIGKYLQDKYKAKILIIGGRGDIQRAEVIKQFLKEKDLLILADKLELLEIIELLKKAGFLISNDTGAVHMAAAVDLPIIGLYCLRNVFGRWIPPGKNNEMIYHKFLNCDYRTEECIKKSIEAITVDEVKIACDKIVSRL